MRLYLEVARRSYARISTYRGATVAGVFTNTVFGFLLAYVLKAVYSQRATVGGFDETDAITFTFVGQGLLMPLGLFAATEFADRVKSGDVIVDLQRPYHQQAWWAAVEYGKAAYYLLFRGVPPFLAGALVFDLRLPSAGGAVLFLGSVALAIGVSFGWRYLLQLTSFWLIDVRGTHQLGLLVAHLMCGAYIPIVFFPPWLEQTCRLLPFASMMQVPIEAWLGRLTGAELILSVAWQLAWLAGLAVAGRAVLDRGVRKVVIQGG